MGSHEHLCSHPCECIKPLASTCVVCGIAECTSKPEVKKLWQERWPLNSPETLRMAYACWDDLHYTGDPEVEWPVALR